MEGELEILETAWKQAEEIAGIADSLLMPAEVDEFLTSEKERVSSEPKIIVPAGAGISAPGESANGLPQRACRGSPKRAWRRNPRHVGQSRKTPRKNHR